MKQKGRKFLAKNLLQGSPLSSILFYHLRLKYKAGRSEVIIRGRETVSNRFGHEAFLPFLNLSPFPLHFDCEMTDLGVIRMYCQFQDQHVPEDLRAIETTDDDKSTIMQDRAMISSAARWEAVYASFVPRHVDQVKEQDVVGVFGAIMAAHDEEV